MTVVGLFAGVGWAEGLATLGRSEVGLELDAAACATRQAAGHPTIRCDAWTWPPPPLLEGLIASPPCTVFSAAGKGAGRAVMGELAAAIRDGFAGGSMRGHTRRVAGAIACTADGKLTRRERSEWGRRQALTSMLMVVPARWVAACRPGWVAMEQVPAAMPLWRVYAEELRRLGYRVWCGVLNAADFGVPQTRKRAFLLASQGVLSLPEPTHAERPGPDGLFGAARLPWVSMAVALGWGYEDRGLPTVTAGGGERGGAEPFWHAARKELALVIDRRTNSKGQGGSLVPTVPVPVGRPSPTLTSIAGGQWVLRNGNQPNAAPGSVQITVDEAATLQGFRPDMPWPQTRTAAFRLIGNAVCPPMAAAVLAGLIGVREAAA